MPLASITAIIAIASKVGGACEAVRNRFLPRSVLGRLSVAAAARTGIRPTRPTGVTNGATYSSVQLECR